MTKIYNQQGELTVDTDSDFFKVENITAEEWCAIMQTVSGVALYDNNGNLRVRLGSDT